MCFQIAFHIIVIFKKDLFGWSIRYYCSFSPGLQAYGLIHNILKSIRGSFVQFIGQVNAIGVATETLGNVTQGVLVLLESTVQ